MSDQGAADPCRVLIIGAGLAGLTAARSLAGSAVLVEGVERPVAVTVIDKAKGPGGRLATRRIKAPGSSGPEAILDHGAQFFTVRSEEFAAEAQRWLGDGVIQEWSRGFPSSAKPGQGEGEPDGHPRYYATGGMNQLAKHLAQNLKDQGVKILRRQRAEAIIKGPDLWTVTYQGYTRQPDDALAIIATPPVPQTVELLAAGASMPEPQLAAKLRATSYHPVIGLLATLDQAPAIPAPGAVQQPDHPVFSFVADNQAKGISPVPSLTAHLSHALSQELFDLDDATILDRVNDEFASILGPATAVTVQVKRWRYATPVAPSDEGSLLAASTPGPLVLAGDAFAGAKVEGAFLSGLHAARRVLDGLNSAQQAG